MKNFFSRLYQTILDRINGLILYICNPHPLIYILIIGILLVALFLIIPTSVTNRAIFPLLLESDCLYQRMPVTDMPVIPFDDPFQPDSECPSYIKIVQWNAYVKPLPTDWEEGVPLGLRYRNCPTLFTNSPLSHKCSAIGTAYAFCENPPSYGYKCTDQLLYGETIIYREAIPELGWYDKGYFLQMNYWGWYPLCVTLPNKEEVCYTDWTPNENIKNEVNLWKINR